MVLKIAVLSPEDLSRQNANLKVYTESKLLSKFGQVTLFGSASANVVLKLIIDYYKIRLYLLVEKIESE